MNRESMLGRVGHLQQWGGTRLITLEDGAERGARVVEFRTTAGLEFGVLVDRGLDIAWTRYQGRSIAWHSPAGFTGPQLAELDTAYGWARSFGGGLLVTAGLDHVLFPEHDPLDTYGVGARSDGTSYGMHGRVSGIPGRLTGYGEVWRDDTCYLFVEAEIDQAAGLGEHLRLLRRIETTLDGRTILWTDRVENVGHLATPHMLLYHINFGAPLIDERSALVIPSRAIRWTSSKLGREESQYVRAFSPPTRGFVPQTFEHDIVPDRNGRAEIAIINRADETRPWGVVLDYDVERFPYLFQWRFLGEGTYLTALEPSTNGPLGRRNARASGELLMLEPGETRTSATRIQILDGIDECAAASANITPGPEATG